MIVFVSAQPNGLRERGGEVGLKTNYGGRTRV